jgi:integrase
LHHRHLIYSDVRTSARALRARAITPSFPNVNTIDRDRLLILLAFRHARRLSELVDIKVGPIDLKAATIHIRRAKNGTPGIHGLQGDELRLIRPVAAGEPE